PYVGALIRRFSNDAETRRDLSGESYLIFRGLLERYQPDRGVPLKPYLITQLKAHLYSHCRSKRCVSRRETPFGGIDQNGYGGADPTETWDLELERKRLIEGLPEILRSVPIRQRYVILWRYFDEVSFEEIGVRLGV